MPRKGDCKVETAWAKSIGTLPNDVNIASHRRVQFTRRHVADVASLHSASSFGPLVSGYVARNSVHPGRTLYVRVLLFAPLNKHH
jgi:hypothetical protein